MRRIAIIVVCCGLFPVAACTRTSDGTVVMKKPPQISSLLPSWTPWKRRKADPAPVPVAFPPPPAAAPVKPRQKPLLPQARAMTLDCTNRSDAGGRVRVVCK
jgi:hypothetical protein